MDWEEDKQLPTGNEIRFADEILPGGQDEIGTLCRRNPLHRSGRGHRDATLLRTRYVDQRGVRNARAFWEYRGQLAA